jgi:hypothetical protein
MEITGRRDQWKTHGKKTEKISILLISTIDAETRRHNLHLYRHAIRSTTSMLKIATVFAMS